MRKALLLSRPKSPNSSSFHATSSFLHGRTGERKMASALIPQLDNTKNGPITRGLVVRSEVLGKHSEWFCTFAKIPLYSLFLICLLCSIEEKLILLLLGKLISRGRLTTFRDDGIFSHMICVGFAALLQDVAVFLTVDFYYFCYSYLPLREEKSQDYCTFYERNYSRLFYRKKRRVSIHQYIYRCRMYKISLFPERQPCCLINYSYQRSPRKELRVTECS